jgi:hypothetical protein
MEETYYKAMALADGELDSADLPELVDHLYHDKALMRATQSLFDLRRYRIARLFARKLDEPLPQHILDTAWTAPMGKSSSGAGVFAYGGALFDRLRERYRMPGWSLAAGPAFAAAVAVAASWVLVPARGFEPALTPQIEAALERAVGGTDASVPALRILQTYWSSDQSWCRQFDVQSSTQLTSALACRWGEGKWGVVLQTPPVSAGVTTPASPPRAYLDSYVRSHMSAPALDPAQEMSAINSGWEPPAAR